ncbi:MAG: hypothetical protein B6247_04050 [Candidatus Parabeggiatoa sp. nov. 2]|nr:MAG: hypothetical protein B6247_04050 [Beggiatoa sp. 4572_84]
MDKYTRLIELSQIPQLWKSDFQPVRGVNGEIFTDFEYSENGQLTFSSSTTGFSRAAKDWIYSTCWYLYQLKNSSLLQAFINQWLTKEYCLTEVLFQLKSSKGTNDGLWESGMAFLEIGDKIYSYDGSGKSVFEIAVGLRDAIANNDDGITAYERSSGLLVDLKAKSEDFHISAYVSNTKRLEELKIEKKLFRYVNRKLYVLPKTTDAFFNHWGERPVSLKFYNVYITRTKETDEIPPLEGSDELPDLVLFFGLTGSHPLEYNKWIVFAIKLRTLLQIKRDKAYYEDSYFRSYLLKPKDEYIEYDLRSLISERELLADQIGHSHFHTESNGFFVQFIQELSNFDYSPMNAIISDYQFPNKYILENFVQVLKNKLSGKYRVYREKSIDISSSYIDVTEEIRKIYMSPYISFSLEMDSIFGIFGSLYHYQGYYKATALLKNFQIVFENNDFVLKNVEVGWNDYVIRKGELYPINQVINQNVFGAMRIKYSDIFYKYQDIYWKNQNGEGICFYKDKPVYSTSNIENFKGGNFASFRVAVTVFGKEASCENAFNIRMNEGGYDSAINYNSYNGFHTEVPVTHLPIYAKEFPEDWLGAVVDITKSEPVCYAKLGPWKNKALILRQDVIDVLDSGLLSDELDFFELTSDNKEQAQSELEKISDKLANLDPSLLKKISLYKKRITEFQKIVHDSAILHDDVKELTDIYNSIIPKRIEQQNQQKEVIKQIRRSFFEYVELQYTVIVNVNDFANPELIELLQPGQTFFIYHQD